MEGGPRGASNTAAGGLIPLAPSHSQVTYHSVERTGLKEIFQALWKVLPMAGVGEGLFTPPSWAGSRDVVPEEAGVTIDCPESHMPHTPPEQQHLDAVQGKHPSPLESLPT